MGVRYIFNFPAWRRRDDVKYNFDDCLRQVTLEMIGLKVHVYSMCLGAKYFFSSELLGTILFQYKLRAKHSNSSISPIAT
jgi:hypothetical protein